MDVPFFESFDSLHMYEILHVSMMVFVYACSF